LPPKSRRRTARSLLDRVLKPVGARVLMSAEERAIAERYKRTFDHLYAVYVAEVFPDLRDRPGREQLLRGLIGTDLPEAMFLLHYLQQARDSGPGDICEMGVAQGATSALLANEILDDGDRSLWLYDSFSGLSVPSSEDLLIDDVFNLGSIHKYAGTMAFPQEFVREQVSGVGLPASRTRVVAGFIHSDVPPVDLPATVAFAYLDFDLYEPILVGLRLLHPRCRPGSVLMVDDYRFFSSGPETAVKEFMTQYPDEYQLFEAPEYAGSFCALRRAQA
jgi:O-methyltransferase